MQLDARIFPKPGDAPKPADAPKSGDAASSAATSAPALIPASQWARGLEFSPARHASAVQPSATHAAAAQTPVGHAVPATSTVQVKPSAAQPKVAPAKAAPANEAPAKAAPARKAPAKAAPVHVAPTKPYFIYDSTTPTAIPAHQRVAVYANGMYQASWSEVAGRGKVLWIDTNGNNPGANVVDVEPGDATPAGAANWVKARLNTYQNQLAIVYTYLSAWQAVKASVASLPSWMQAKVRYWIADPTGVNHVVSGSSATQWYWGKTYDITTATPGFEAQ